MSWSMLLLIVSLTMAALRRAWSIRWSVWLRRTSRRKTLSVMTLTSAMAAASRTPSRFHHAIGTVCIGSYRADSKPTASEARAIVEDFNG